MRDLIPRRSTVEIIEQHVAQYFGNYSELANAITAELYRCLAEIQCVPEVKVED